MLIVHAFERKEKPIRAFLYSKGREYVMYSFSFFYMYRAFYWEMCIFVVNMLNLIS